MLNIGCLTKNKRLTSHPNGLFRIHEHEARAASNQQCHDEGGQTAALIMNGIVAVFKRRRSIILYVQPAPETTPKPRFHTKI